MATYLINGDEIDGKYFSPEQKSDDRFVSRALREFAKYQRAKNRYLQFVKEKGIKAFLQKLGDAAQSNDEAAMQGKGRTIYNISRTRRVIIKQNAYIKMNSLAEQAKAIIDSLLKKYEEKLPEDVQDLFGLLKSMFVEKKKMIYTPGIAAFLNMKNIKNRELQRAQELLRKSMDAEMSKVYMYAQKRRGDGSWILVDGAE